MLKERGPEYGTLLSTSKSVPPDPRQSVFP